jgi:hypothetical protein
MARVELPYARWDQPGAQALQIFDGVTGERLFNVVEANATEGWRVELITDIRGIRQRTPDGKSVLSRRITGPVRIVQIVQDPAEADQRRRRAAEKRARQGARQAKGMRAAP